MIVFCPNCGSQNAGLAGAKASCSACGSSFDVPGDAPRAAPAPAPPVEPPKAASFSAPGAQVFASSPMPVAQKRGGTNTMAVVSLVFGLICCIPLISPGLAIGCGVVGLRQLDANRDAEGGRALAIAGIVLGGIAALMQLMSLISTLTRRY